MALANYTDLKAEVASYLARSDLTSFVPDFILLAEAKMNRRLKAQAMETKTTSFSINAEYVNVPSDFIEVRHFYITSSNPGTALQYMPPEEMTRQFANQTGKPLYYAPVGSQFRFAKSPNTTYTATLVYYAKIPAMASNATNWLLTAHPDAYLYGSLLEAEAYMQNDPRIPVWKQGFEEAIADINGSSSASRYGGQLAVKPG